MTEHWVQMNTSWASADDAINEDVEDRPGLEVVGVHTSDYVANQNGAQRIAGCGLNISNELGLDLDIFTGAQPVYVARYEGVPLQFQQGLVRTPGRRCRMVAITST